MENEIKELNENRKKLVIDLVEFALEWKKLIKGITILPNALGNYVTVNTMADIILETFTESKFEKAAKEATEEFSEALEELASVEETEKEIN